MFLSKLMPREGDFYGLFIEHGARIMEGSDAFSAMLANYDDPVLREQHARAVDSAERQADKLTAEVVRLLHKSFITPIAREQILSIINAMDDVLDLLQDVTETLTLYDVRALTDEVHQLASLSAKCCHRVQHAVTLLPRLGESDVAEAALKTCDEIDRLESDADRVLRAAMSALFRHEPDVRELIKMKAIYELLEAVTDRCEDVANLIEGVVIEHG